MSNYIYTKNGELMHYGILGMKWGVRRFQNADGSLTKAGERRYNKIDRKADRDGWSDETRELAKTKLKKTKQLSNVELRKLNERNQLEITNRDLRRKQRRGQQAVDIFVKTAGTITAVAVAAGTYKKYGSKIVKAASKIIVKSPKYINL